MNRMTMKAEHAADSYNTWTPTTEFSFDVRLADTLPIVVTYLLGGLIKKIDHRNINAFAEGSQQGIVIPLVHGDRND